MTTGQKVLSDISVSCLTLNYDDCFADLFDSKLSASTQASLSESEDCAGQET